MTNKDKLSIGAKLLTNMKTENKTIAMQHKYFLIYKNNYFGYKCKSKRHYRNAYKYLFKKYVQSFIVQLIKKKTERLQWVQEVVTHFI